VLDVVAVPTVRLANSGEVEITPIAVRSNTLTVMLELGEIGSRKEIESALAEPTQAKVTAMRMNGSNVRAFICLPSFVSGSRALYPRDWESQAFRMPKMILNGGGRLRGPV
jgi:hypothetical protein